MMKRRVLAGNSRFVIFVLAAVLAGAAGLSGAVPADRRVSPEWLQQNMTRPDLRIVDMRGDVREYWEGHLPGAVFLDSAVLRWADRGVPLKLMPVSALALLLGEMGIGRETTIVVYSEINHYRATYFLWALDAVGHKNWALLEGGYEGWKTAGADADAGLSGPPAGRLPGAQGLRPGRPGDTGRSP